jgi:hypothetical protein
MPFLQPCVDYLEQELVDVDVLFPLVVPAAKMALHKSEFILSIWVHARELRLEPIEIRVDCTMGLTAVEVSIVIIDDVRCEAYGNVAVWTNVG